MGNYRRLQLLAVCLSWCLETAIKTLIPEKYGLRIFLRSAMKIRRCDSACGGSSAWELVPAAHLIGSDPVSERQSRSPWTDLKISNNHGSLSLVGSSSACPHTVLDEETTPLSRSTVHPSLFFSGSMRGPATAYAQ